MVRGQPSESFTAVRQVAAPAIIVLVHWTLDVLLNLFIKAFYINSDIGFIFHSSFHSFFGWQL
jgi:hypothetical protein